MSLPARSQTSAEARWQALGSDVVLRLADARATLAPARAAVERELEHIDQACSRFRADSELQQLNARGGRTTKVSALLAEAVEVALRAAELTAGDVDPTLGRALELAGYDRDRQLLAAPRGQPAQPVRVRVLARKGWRAVEFDRTRSTIKLPKQIKLDLGATAKAWAADRAAIAAASSVGCGVLVSLGGDIATSGTPPPEGWRIHVTDDHRSSAEAPGQTIAIRSGGMATSSTAVRRWSNGAHTMHHIIDPATEAPVQNTWRTVSVLAADCTDANIASTAALVRTAAAPRWLEQIGLPARLLAQNGTVTFIAGWPAPLSRSDDACKPLRSAA